MLPQRFAINVAGAYPGLIGRGGATERCLGLVVGGHEWLDFGDQPFYTGVAASADRLLGDDPKPALPLIEPGGVGGLVHVEAASLCQPGPDLGVLLRAVHGLDLSLLVDAEHHRLVGGFRYRPTMSRTVSTKKGSIESL